MSFYCDFRQQQHGCHGSVPEAHARSLSPGDGDTSCAGSAQLQVKLMKPSHIRKEGPNAQELMYGLSLGRIIQVNYVRFKFIL